MTMASPAMAPATLSNWRTGGPQPHSAQRVGQVLGSLLAYCATRYKAFQRLPPSIRRAAYTLLLALLLRWKGFRALQYALAAVNGTPIPRQISVTRRANVRIEGDGRPMLEMDIYFPEPNNFYTRSPRKENVMKEEYPALLIRTPYSKFLLQYMGQRFCEHGFIVIIQDCRGRFGSDGDFSYAGDEVEDSIRTLRWIKRQSWFNGKLGMFGISYLGIVQWAALHAQVQCQRKGDHDIATLSALVPVMTTSNMCQINNSDNSYAMDLALRYTHLMYTVGGEGTHKFFRWGSTEGNPDLGEGKAARPRMLSIPGLIYLNRPVWWVQDHLMAEASREKSFVNAVKRMGCPLVTTYNPNPKGKWWAPRSYTESVPLAPPSHIMGGWFDMFLRSTLADFSAVQKHNVEARQQGRSPQYFLTIGPWTHFESLQFHCFRVVLQEGLTFLRHQLRGEGSMDYRKAVRLYVMNERPSSGKWKEFDTWPPPAIEVKHFLHPEGLLQRNEPPRCQDSYTTYTYDPENPTPTHGGPVFHPIAAGAVENRPLEQREDTIVFTSEPLQQDLEIVGYVRLVLYAWSSTGHMVDYYGRLCDVDPKGNSHHVCDGLIRVKPAVTTSKSASDFVEIQPKGRKAERAAAEEAKGTDVPMEVEIDLWATAKRFLKGHRLRVMIASGSHPRWIRNSGTLDALTDMQSFTKAKIKIFHDRKYPSHLITPAVAGADPSKAIKGVKAQSAMRRVFSQETILKTLDSFIPGPQIPG